VQLRAPSPSWDTPGRISLQGTHDDLMAIPQGVYRSMVERAERRPDAALGSTTTVEEDDEEGVAPVDGIEAGSRVLKLVRAA
jgi:hypothetical protein